MFPSQIKGPNQDRNGLHRQNSAMDVNRNPTAPATNPVMPTNNDADEHLQSLFEEYGQVKRELEVALEKVDSLMRQFDFADPIQVELYFIAEERLYEELNYHSLLTRFLALENQIRNS